MFIKKKFIKNKNEIFIYKKIYFIKSWLFIIYFIKFFGRFEKKIFHIKSEEVYKKTFLRLLTHLQIYLKNNFFKRLAKKKKDAVINKIQE